MIKPCIPDEFIARVNALARRKTIGRQGKKVTGSFTYKDITYFPETQIITQQ
jgi:DNA-binding response OmpR family regulator